MLGWDKVRHMTPNFGILSISTVLDTVHILVASGSSQDVSVRQGSACCRLWTLHITYSFYTFSDTQLATMPLHCVVLASV